MSLDFKLWVTTVLSLVGYLVTEFLRDYSGNSFFTNPDTWYLFWVELYIVATWYSYKLIKKKKRSGAWVGLPFCMGIVGVTLVFLLSARKN